MKIRRWDFYFYRTDDPNHCENKCTLLLFSIEKVD